MSLILYDALLFDTDSKSFIQIQVWAKSTEDLSERVLSEVGKGLGTVQILSPKALNDKRFSVSKEAATEHLIQSIIADIENGVGQ